MSASLAAVPLTVWTNPEATSPPIWAFIPKCHWLAFLVWCISGSRLCCLFLVEDGAAMIVASTSVPCRISKPRSSSIALTASNSPWVKSCRSSQCRKCSTVVASGIGSRFSTIPAKPRRAWLSPGSSPRAGSECILDRFIGQPVPLLHKRDPQHAVQWERWPAAFAFRIERPQSLLQPRPWYNLLHIGQKLVAPRLLLLAGVFCLRKASLPMHQFAPGYRTG